MLRRGRGKHSCLTGSQLFRTMPWISARSSAFRLANHLRQAAVRWVMATLTRKGGVGASTRSSSSATAKATGSTPTSLVELERAVLVRNHGGEKSMKALLAAGFILLGSCLADAKTCTAPGHSTCTITCPAGCIALYSEPNGPCRTTCSGSAASAAAFSADGMSVRAIRDFLRKRPESK